MELEGYPTTLKLKDGREVTIRAISREDERRLSEFFRSLPEEDRLFLRDDVTDPRVIESYMERIGKETVLSIVALAGDRIVGDGTLHWSKHGWSRHVGQIRVVVARDYQRCGLGTLLARELVKQAVAMGLDKLVAEVVENQIGAKRAFGKLGFTPEAVLRNHVLDIHGRKRDLVIMANDVSHIWATMESLVSDFNPTLGG